MLDCLAIEDTVKGVTKKYWMSGVDLLTLAQQTVDEFNTDGFLCRGDGSYDTPWQLDGEVRTWLQMARSLQGYINVERYFVICGRFVIKAMGYYMGDGGGVSDDSGFAPWNRKGDGQPFDRGGPSYRNYGNQFKKLQGNSGVDMQKWTQDTTGKLVKTLQGDDGMRAQLATAGNLTVGQTLPVLAATMFLAEPARNPRCFLINKMLLDMMGVGITYGGRKPGKSPKTYTIDKVMLRDPQEKGGKMPAAMAGSASAAKPIRPNPMALGSGAYTQAKELTILCHYFSELYGVTGTNASLVSGTHTQHKLVGTPPINTERNYSEAASAFGYLKYMMQQTLHSFAP